MRSTPLFPSFPGPHWPEVVAPIYRSNRNKLCNYAKLNCLKLTVFRFNCVKQNLILILKGIVWNRTVFDIETVCKLKNYTYTKVNCVKLLSTWLNSTLNDPKRLIRRKANEPTNNSDTVMRYQVFLSNTYNSFTDLFNWYTRLNIPYNSGTE